MNKETNGYFSIHHLTIGEEPEVSEVSDGVVRLVEAIDRVLPLSDIGGLADVHTWITQYHMLSATHTLHKHRVTLLYTALHITTQKKALTIEV